jgi:hypothetical protein
MDNNNTVVPVRTTTSSRVAAILARDPELERIVAQMEVGVRWAEPGRDKPWNIVASGRHFHLCYWKTEYEGWSYVDYYLQSIDWEEEKSDD